MRRFDRAAARRATRPSPRVPRARRSPSGARRGRACDARGPGARRRARAGATRGTRSASAGGAPVSSEVTSASMRSCARRRRSAPSDVRRWRAASSAEADAGPCTSRTRLTTPSNHSSGSRGTEHARAPASSVAALAPLLQPGLVDVAVACERAPAIARHRERRSLRERAHVALRGREHLARDPHGRALAREGGLERRRVEHAALAEDLHDAIGVEDAHRRGDMNARREQYRMPVETREELDPPLQRLPAIVVALANGPVAPSRITRVTPILCSKCYETRVLVAAPEVRLPAREAVERAARASSSVASGRRRWTRARPGATGTRSTRARPSGACPMRWCSPSRPTTSPRRSRSPRSTASRSRRARAARGERAARCRSRAASCSRRSGMARIDRDRPPGSARRRRARASSPADLHAAVEAEGLFYPPDPELARRPARSAATSPRTRAARAPSSTASRASTCSASRRASWAGASLRTGRRTIKGVTGYDVTALLVGSEGTLGVFTEVTLRLVPKPDRGGDACSRSSPTCRAAADAVRRDRRRAASCRAASS